MEELKLTIKGFKTEDALIEFINWYEGQGEQDIDIWMDCRKEEGADIQNNFLTKSLEWGDKVIIIS